jgi:allantoicase
MHYSHPQNLIMPGRAKNMGDGWETKRRRGPGHDWMILRLGAAGTLKKVEIDTNHFKGNYPDSCMLEGVHKPGASGQELADEFTPWATILPQTKLKAHFRHFFDKQLVAHGPITHVRLNIYPDGGVSRLRLLGSRA